MCINRPALVLVDALGFLGVKDQNEVRLPVVKFLASQRASSIQALVTYFIVVRLVFASVALIPNGAAEVRGGSGVGPGVGSGVGPGVGPGVQGLDPEYRRNLSKTTEAPAGLPADLLI